VRKPRGVGWTGWCPASCFQNESSCLYTYILIYRPNVNTLCVCVGVPVVYVCSKTSMRALGDVFLNAKGSKNPFRAKSVWLGQKSLL
jgi:hypothetical protein